MIQILYLIIRLLEIIVSTKVFLKDEFKLMKINENIHGERELETDPVTSTITINNDRFNRRYIRSCGMYLLLFLICIGFYMINMAVEHVYPFGSRSFLYQDACDQYPGILKIFLEWLHSGDKGSFIWERGLGIDIVLNMFYYCMSPFNIIAIVLGPDRVELSMTLMIVLKASCLAPAGLFFFRHSKIRRFAEKGLSEKYITVISMMFGLLYALNSYVVVYNHNVLWLDGLILLPFIAIAVEHLAEGKWQLRYTLLLACAFLFNYYFAFYICLFIVCYFFMQDWKNAKNLWSGVCRFFGWSVMAVSIAGMVVLPSLYAIMNLSSCGNGDYSLPWYRISNLGMFVNSFYPLRQISTGYLFSHNNYCGILVIMFFLLFLFGAGIKCSFKLRYTAVILFLTIGLNMVGLNYVLHGFTITHGLGNRFAFILVFFILMAGYIGMLRLQQVKVWQIISMSGIGITIFLLELFLNKEDANSYSYAAVLLFGISYLILLILYVRKSIRYTTCYVWMIVLLCIEIFANAWIQMPQKYNDERLQSEISASDWLTDYEQLQLAEGERKTALVSQNYMPYSDVNWYSSVANGSIVDVFTSLGISRYQNIEYTYRGVTPISRQFFNVRYVVTDETGVAGGYRLIDRKNEKIDFYEADNLAGMGFLMSKDVLDWSGTAKTEDTSDVFEKGSMAENQNELVKLVTGHKITQNAFTRIDIPEDAVTSAGMDITGQKNGEYSYISTNDVFSAITVNLTAEKDEDLYLECADTKPQCIEVKVNDEVTVSTNYTDSADFYHVGQVKEGDAVQIRMYAIRIRLYTTAVKDQEGTKAFALYSLDQNVVKAFEEYTESHQMTFDGWADNTLNGHITTEESGILYLAVPYNKGFSAVVNGKKVAPVKIGTGLMGVPVEAGEHVITLTYNTPYLMAGICLSVIGILILAGYVMISRKKSSNK